MAKICSDPRVAYPDVKVKVRYLVRVVCTRGQYSGGIHFIEPQGVNGHRRPVPGAPQQRYDTGEPGKVQVRDRMGIVEGSCGYFYIIDYNSFRKNPLFYLFPIHKHRGQI